MRIGFTVSTLVGLAMLCAEGCSRPVEKPVNSATQSPAAAAPAATSAPVVIPIADKTPLPSWMPHYPNAKAEQIDTTISSIGGTRYMINFSTADSPAAVFKFYKDKLIPLGFKQTMAMDALIELKREPEEMQITGIAGSGASGTSVAIIMEAKTK